MAVGDKRESRGHLLLSEASTAETTGLHLCQPVHIILAAFDHTWAMLSLNTCGTSPLERQVSNDASVYHTKHVVCDWSCDLDRPRKCDCIVEHCIGSPASCSPIMRPLPAANLPARSSASTPTLSPRPSIQPRPIFHFPSSFLARSYVWCKAPSRPPHPIPYRTRPSTCRRRFPRPWLCRIQAPELQSRCHTDTWF